MVEAAWSSRPDFGCLGKQPAEGLSQLHAGRDHATKPSIESHQATMHGLLYGRRSAHGTELFQHASYVGSCRSSSLSSPGTIRQINIRPAAMKQKAAPTPAILSTSISIGKNLHG